MVAGGAKLTSEDVSHGDIGGDPKRTGLMLVSDHMISHFCF